MRVLWVILVLLGNASAFGCDACRDSDVLRDDIQSAFQSYNTPPPGVAISSTPKAVTEESVEPRPRDVVPAVEASPVEPAFVPREATMELPRSRPNRTFLRSLQDY